MRIHDIKAFGLHVCLTRRAAKLDLQSLARKVDIDPRILDALERGNVGEEVGDDLLADLCGAVPGLSLATAPGVYPPGVPTGMKNQEDLVKIGRNR